VYRIIQPGFAQCSGIAEFRAAFVCVNRSVVYRGH